MGKQLPEDTERRQLFNWEGRAVPAHVLTKTETVKRAHEDQRVKLCVGSCSPIPTYNVNIPKVT